jgi:CubicO group peptidase (beta-lactamase class C family)
MLQDTVFDVASLTKVLAVWPSIGALVDAGDLTLDRRLATFWPEVEGQPAGQVTARQLLTLTAGMPLRANLKNLYGTDPTAVRAGVLGEELRRRPGEAVEYADRAALLLGYLAQHLSGQPLDQFATEQIWVPLQMDSTRFGPLPPDVAARCPPTEFDPDTGTRIKGTHTTRLLRPPPRRRMWHRRRLLHHRRPQRVPAVSPAARRLGGPTRLGPDWINESLTIQTGQLESARGLFWHPAPGSDPADDVWVHYGFTGTGMWLSPKRGTWAVLLTNKLYYTRDRQPLTDIRNTFRQIAMDIPRTTATPPSIDSELGGGICAAPDIADRLTKHCQAGVRRTAH